MNSGNRIYTRLGVFTWLRSSVAKDLNKLLFFALYIK